MKKNGLLTFIFACIPGAGQMYYGYMQRGLSIAMILILCVMAATVIQPLLFLCLVIWMYSFFDTYDLILSLIHIYKYHKTIVLITHNPELAEECQRVLTLRDGLIVGERKGTGERAAF